MRREQYGRDGSLHAVVEDITPAKATRYLTRNKENRAIKTAFVERLAAAILRGEWVFNGESIKFNYAGNLIDGQHRLRAVELSGKTVSMLVVRNAPEGSQDTVDTGTRRTLSDALRIRGEKNNAALAAALAWLFRIQQADGVKTLTNTGIYPTIQQGLMLLDQHPGIRESKTVASSLNTYLRVPPGLGLALHYIFNSIDSEDALVFSEYLIGGASLDEGDPIYTLRRYLEKQMQLPLKSPQAHPQIYKAAIIIKAWNAYRDGRGVSRLSWSPGGSRKEGFPVPR